MIIQNLVKLSRGSIHPLIIEANSLGLMNPSILFHDNKLRVILRNVNYTFYHSEKNLFHHPFGPLTYIHPENDIKLRTWNWYLELDHDLDIKRHHKIDTSKFDTYEPKWEFVGLEDARLVYWNNCYYITGVRRDTTTEGQGRMELSKLEIYENDVVEVERTRIPLPKGQDTYCEKNWMPIQNKPFTWVKWSNPTEIAMFNPVSGATETTVTSDVKNFPTDERGGSPLIPWNGNQGYISLTHAVNLDKHETGRKNAVYTHRFLQWDNKFKLVKCSKPFNFMGGLVEFSTGMTHYEDSILITFGFQDNAAYILKTNKEFIEEFING